MVAKLIPKIRYHKASFVVIKNDMVTKQTFGMFRLDSTFGVIRNNMITKLHMLDNNLHYSY